MTVVLSLIGLLMPFPFTSRAFYRSADLSHLPVFALLTYLAISMTDRFVSRSTMTRILTTLTVVFVSACIELIQAKVGRKASIHDLVANSTGAAAALAFCWSSGRQRVVRWPMRTAAIAAAIYVSTGPLISLVDVYQQETQPDVLGSFASRTELERWYVQSAVVSIIPHSKAGSDGDVGCMEVKFFPGEHPMVQLQELTRDWSDYDTLSFEVSQPANMTDKPITIQLRVSDQNRIRGDDGSFFQRFDIPPGSSETFTVPIADLANPHLATSEERPVNIRMIRFLEFMAMNLEEETILRFANIRLNGNAKK